MKQITIICLIITFLTANYAYANFPLEELSQKMESVSYQGLTQEEFEELLDEFFINFMSSINSELLGEGSLDELAMGKLDTIEPNLELFIGNPIIDIILLFIYLNPITHWIVGVGFDVYILSLMMYYFAEFAVYLIINLPQILMSAAEFIAYVSYKAIELFVYISAATLYVLGAAFYYAVQLFLYILIIVFGNIIIII